MTLVKKKRFWLSAALTLVLGISMLSWTIAAPVLSLVKNSVPEERLARMTLSEARAGGATLMESILLAAPRTTGNTPSIAPAYKSNRSGAAAQNAPMLASPATIAVGPQYAADIPRDMMDAKDAGGWWAQQAYADVFSSASGSPYTRQSALDDPLRDDLDLVKLLLPGQGGTYRFTLVNKENFAIDWWLTITDENMIDYDDKFIPMEFRLLQDGAYVAPSNATTWVGIDDVGAALGNLAASGQVIFDLEWRWVFEDLANLLPRDASDTDLGRMATKISTMPYYRLLFNIYAEAEEQGCGCGCGCDPECLCGYEGCTDCTNCGCECSKKKPCKWPPIIPIPIPVPLPIVVPIPVPVIVLPPCCEEECDCGDDDCCCGKPDCCDHGKCCCTCGECKPTDPVDPTKPTDPVDPSKPIVDTGDHFQVWPILALMVWSAGAILLLAKRRTEDEEAG